MGISEGGGSDELRANGSLGVKAEFDMPRGTGMFKLGPPGTAAARGLRPGICKKFRGDG